MRSRPRHAKPRRLLLLSFSALALLSAGLAFLLFLTHGTHG